MTFRIKDEAIHIEAALKEIIGAQMNRLNYGISLASDNKVNLTIEALGPIVLMVKIENMLYDFGWTLELFSNVVTGNTFKVGDEDISERQITLHFSKRFEQERKYSTPKKK